MARLGLMFVFALLVACSNDSTREQPRITPGGSAGENRPIPNNDQTQDYRIAIVGNSHVAGMTALLENLIPQVAPNKSVEAKMIGSGFLSDSSSNEKAFENLKNGNWTHIILQGQKYSQSRSRLYPTDGARLWISRAKELGITPILFPEHPQRWDITEAQYVHDIHKGIATIASSCIAPVGLAWNELFMLSPRLDLHAADGNHASPLGKYYSAMVFAEVITGVPVNTVAFDELEDVSGDLNLLMSQAVSQTIEAHPPCG